MVDYATLDWSKVRILGERVVGRVLPPTTSRHVIMLDHLGSSTVEIVAKGAAVDFPVGAHVIIDKAPAIPLTGKDACGDLLMFHADTIIVLLEHDPLAEGYILVAARESELIGVEIEEEVPATAIKAVGERFTDYVRVRAGRTELDMSREFLVPKPAGWIVRWMGEHFRVFDLERDAVLEVEDE